MVKRYGFRGTLAIKYKIDFWNNPITASVLVWNQVVLNQSQQLGYLNSKLMLSWDCPFKAEILRRYHANLEINAKNWFFSVDLEPKETYIVTLPKMVIHEARNRNTVPSIVHLIHKLKWIIKIEYNAFRLKHKQENFLEKWGTMKYINI